MTQDTGTATIDPRSTAWPSTDGAPAVVDAAPPSPAASGAVKARRDNPLVAGLVRAMREAAQTAKDESLVRFAESAKARVEGIHAASADAAADIRRQSEQDIAGIREWSKAEMARIREETEERIADRKRRLEVEVDEHAARVEHRIELVQAAVATFEAEMERFYVALLAEEDPARLAGFAEQLPEPPTFEEDSADSWSPTRTLDSENAAAAEASFLAGLDETIVDDDVLIGADDSEPLAAVETAETPAAEAVETTETPAADAAGLVEDDADVVRRLATFTDPAPKRESVTTVLSVVGLISVASIAGFKRTLGRSAGVNSVSVASGPNGDFLFTVQHAASTDLRTLIPDLAGYTASVTGDADGVLTVAASESDEAS